MTRSRTRFAAWGALVALGSAAVVGLAGYGLVEQQAYVRDARQKAADYAGRAAARQRQACARAVPSARVECLGAARVEHELKVGDVRREYEDLVAQRTSALWTFIMGMAALIGMALSAVGVILVKQTFDETRRTNRIAMRENARATRRALAGVRDTEAALAIAARNADAAQNQAKITEQALDHTRRMADAAGRQVEVAKDTATKQLRAYVGPNAANYTLQLAEDGTGAFAASVEITNYGQTPAYKYRNTGALARRAFPLVAIPVAEAAGGLPHVLFPTMKTYVSVALPMSASEVQTFLSGSICFFSTFIFEYEDFEGSAHTQTVRYLSHINSPNMLRATHTGQLTFHSGDGD